MAANHPGFSKSVLDDPFVKPHLEAMKSQLTEEAYTAACERGKALDFEATVAELLEHARTDTAQSERVLKKDRK